MSVGAAGPQLTIHAVDCRRDGTSGARFWLVHFTDHDARRDFLAAVFPPSCAQDAAPGEGHRITVLALDLLPSIAHRGNAWRAELYAPELHRAIAQTQRPTIR